MTRASPSLIPTEMRGNEIFDERYFDQRAASGWEVSFRNEEVIRRLDTKCWLDTSRTGWREKADARNLMKKERIQHEKILYVGRKKELAGSVYNFMTMRIAEITPDDV